MENKFIAGSGAQVSESTFLSRVFLWMALTKRTDEKWILFLMLILVAYFLFLGGGGAYSRFRVPIAPVLAIASAVGMGWYRHRGFTGCVATQ